MIPLWGMIVTNTNNFNLCDFAEFNQHLYLEIPLDEQELQEKFSNDFVYWSLNDFDKDGFELTSIERHILENNFLSPSCYINKWAMQNKWYHQSPTCQGTVVDHALILERYAFSGELLEQLNRWAKRYPIIHKLTQIKPKWGIDFSLDWVDQDGVIELVHIEYDSNDLDQVLKVKQQIEHDIETSDFIRMAEKLKRVQPLLSTLSSVAQNNYRVREFLGLGPSLPAEKLQKVWK